MDDVNGKVGVEGLEVKFKEVRTSDGAEGAEEVGECKGKDGFPSGVEAVADGVDEVTERGILLESRSDIGIFSVFSFRL